MMTSGRTVNSVQDALTIALQILESAKEEVVWIAPSSLLTLCMLCGSVERTKTFIQNGGVSRGIVPVSQANIKDIEICLDSGDDVRHADEMQEFLLFVADSLQSISAINIGIDEFTFDTPVVAFWSDDPTYAEYLLASFENAWSQAIPAAQRMRDLLERGTE
ncbi:MAG: hypothetical protein ACXV44_08985 [Halobacteriota archaeon]